MISGLWIINIGYKGGKLCHLPYILVRSNFGMYGKWHNSPSSWPILMIQRPTIIVFHVSNTSEWARWWLDRIWLVFGVLRGKLHLLHYWAILEYMENDITFHPVNQFWWSKDLQSYFFMCKTVLSGLDDDWISFGRFLGCSKGNCPYYSTGRFSDVWKIQLFPVQLTNFDDPKT